MNDKCFEQKPFFRRIIQISSNPSDAINTGGAWALCNDGTLWFYRSSENDWHKMKAIPQDEEQE